MSSFVVHSISFFFLFDPSILFGSVIITLRMGSRLRYRKPVLGLILLITLAFSILIAVMHYPTNKPETTTKNFLVGLMETGNNTQTKRIIDQVKDYTNLVIISNMDVIKNVTALDEIVDYTYNSGLHFIVRMQFPTPYNHFNYDPFQWQKTAESKYGTYFLGFYIYDEPGGNQLDLASFRQFDNTTLPASYKDATNTYVYYLYAQMRDFVKTQKVVTSDYGLYWFDYEAGYDTVFCEFVWNQSRTMSIDLCRGAAEMHNKTWGVTITWKYDKQPYLESGDELYADMVTAYQAGADYLVIYNAPDIGPYGVLTKDHLDALTNFKNYVSANVQNKTSNTQRRAFVLPQDYGWGLRNINDRIWGVWPADDKSSGIWNQITNLTQTYGNNFDIIYDSLWTRLFAKTHYNELV